MSEDNNHNENSEELSERKRKAKTKTRLSSRRVKMETDRGLTFDKSNGRFYSERQSYIKDLKEMLDRTTIKPEEKKELLRMAKSIYDEDALGNVSPSKYRQCNNCGNKIYDGKIKTCPVCKEKEQNFEHILHDDCLDFYTDAKDRRHNNGVIKKAYMDAENRSTRLGKYELGFVDGKYVAQDTETGETISLDQNESTSYDPFDSTIPHEQNEPSTRVSRDYTSCTPLTAEESMIKKTEDEVRMHIADCIHYNKQESLFNEFEKGSINIPELLANLGLSRELIERVNRVRKGEDCEK